LVVALEELEQLAGDAPLEVPLDVAADLALVVRQAAYARVSGS
jgi:hypothetical protein